MFRLKIRIFLPLTVCLLTLFEEGIWAQSAIDPREGLPVVSWKDAREVTRQRAIVFGTVVDVGGTDNIQFLNFSKSDRSAFKVVIFARSLSSFSEPLRKTYLNQRIAVEGFVNLYDGNPQIVVSDPDQIEIVSAFPEPQVPVRPTTAALSEHLTLATFNVRNLFDPYDDPYANDESTPEKPRGELEALAATIRQVNADVLALQEVENKGVLRRFLDVFLADLGYRHLALVEGNDTRGIDVAVVSRVPMGRVTSWAGLRFNEDSDGTDRFQRDLLAVELRPAAGDPFEVWVVHLKSKGGSEQSEAIRQTEARYLRRIVDERLSSDSNAAFVICGDFNDEFESPSLQTIVGSGANQLAAHFDDIPQRRRITFNQEPYRSMIDFMLCSPGMDRRYVPKSCRILPGTLESAGSDHNPVVSQFQWRDPGGGPVEVARPTPSVERMAPTASPLTQLVVAFLLGGGMGGWWGYRQRQRP